MASTSNPFEIGKFSTGYNYAGDKAEALGYLDKYASAIGGQERMTDMYGRLSEQYGVPQQQQLVQGLNQQITGLNQRLYETPANVAATTRDSLVTEGQRANLVESKSAPLRRDVVALGSMLTPAQQALSSSQQQVSTQMGLEQAQQAKDLLPFEQGFTVMEQQQARQFSGYTFENQQELNRLIANASNGLSWSNAEADRANQLAIAETNYKRELSKSGGSNNYLSVGEGSAIFDPATGKLVYKNPKTYEPKKTDGGKITWINPGITWNTPSGLNSTLGY